MHPFRPTPSIDELEVSISEFCSMDWGADGENLLGRHKLTTDDRLPYRCLEAVYIVTLLEYGSVVIFCMHTNFIYFVMYYRIRFSRISSQFYIGIRN